MVVDFADLSEAHFQLLLQWLETSVVKKMYDLEKIWRMIDVVEKQKLYNYKFTKDFEESKKRDQAYIIYFYDEPIGCFQASQVNFVYTPSDLSQMYEVNIFICEEKYIKSEIFSKVIQAFVANHWNYAKTHFFARLDHKNTATIIAFKNSGFNELFIDKNNIYLIKTEYIIELVEFCMKSNFYLERNYRTYLYEYALSVLENKNPKNQEETDGLIHCLIGLGLANDKEIYYKKAFSLVNSFVSPKTLFWLNMGMGFHLYGPIQFRDTTSSAHYFREAHNIALTHGLGGKLIRYSKRFFSLT